MGRLLKYLFGAVAAILALILVAGVIVAFTFDPNNYRADLIEAVENKTGREMGIDGELGLSIFPVLSVNMGSVYLRNTERFDSETNLLSFSRADVSIRVLPLLLSREIQMGKVVLDGLAVNLEVASDGTSNWEDLTTNDAPAADDGGSGDGIRINSLEVAGIEFTDANLSYIDRERSSFLELNNVSLTSGRVASGEALPIRGEMEYSVNSGAILGQFELAVTLALLDAELVLSDIDLTSRTEGLIEAPLSAAIEAARIAVDMNAQTVTPGLVSIGAANVDIDADFKPFSYSGPLEPQVKLSAAPFSAQSLMRELGMTPLETADDSALERVSVETLLQVRDEEFSFQDLVLALDDSTLRGLVRVPRRADGVYRIALAGDSIDLTRYMAPPTEAGESADGENANVELPVDLIRAFNVDGTFKLDEATLGNMRFTNAELTAQSMQGKLRLFPIRANLFDGSYSGDITVDASGGTTRLSVNETINGVSLAPLAEALFERNNITGTINGNFKLAGNGNDLDSIRRDLDGNMSFTLLDGTYQGVDLWYQLRRARAVFKQEPAPTPSEPAATKFTNVSATGVVTKGVLQNNDLLAELPFMQLSGRGSVNLVEATVDYNARVVVYERPEFAGASAEELAEFTEAEIPLKITGPLAAPTIRPDIEDMLKERLREEIQKKAIDKLLGDDASEEGKDVEDVVKDKLKDLFKR